MSSNNRFVVQSADELAAVRSGDVALAKHASEDESATAPDNTGQAVPFRILSNEGNARVEKSAPFNELRLADALAGRLPPIRTVGEAWYLFQSGAWQKQSRDALRPQALEILPPKDRTARRADLLLDHLEGRSQLPGDALQGFYRFDGDAVLLNAANGILRVDPERIELLDHDPTCLFTRKTAARYVPTARAELFEKVLSEALPDAQDRELFQLSLGNFLWPDARFEVCLVCHGPAGTGKSTLAEPIISALGESLVQSLSLGQICHPQATFIHALQFTAVNLGTELDALETPDSQNFKLLVSGERVTANPKYLDPFEMKTACKLWFLANGLPRFKHGTGAELRRMRFLRFDSVPAVKDVTLKSRLLAEREGVFNFMLAGLQKLLTLAEIPLGGLESQRVYEGFRISNDPLGAFVERHCHLDSEAQTRKDSLKGAYDEFCQRHGFAPFVTEWFFRRLFERFPALSETRNQVNGERCRFITGLELKTRLDLD